MALKIELIQWTWELRDELIRICNDADRRMLSDGIPHPYTSNDADSWLKHVSEREGKDGIYRAILIDGSVAGTASISRRDGLHRIDSDVGYFLLEPYWSKGIMTVVVGEMCKLAFDTMDIERISGLTFAENIASRRVLEKNGFLFEGIHRRAIIKDGTIHDQADYGRLRQQLPRCWPHPAHTGVVSTLACVPQHRLNAPLKSLMSHIGGHEFKYRKEYLIRIRDWNRLKATG